VQGFLGKLEARFAEHATLAGEGPFFLGRAHPSAADIALLPFLVRFETLLQLYRGFDPILQATPRLAAMFAAFQVRHSACSRHPRHFHLLCECVCVCSDPSNVCCSWCACVCVRAYVCVCLRMNACAYRVRLSQLHE
jgi:hypothetical protein